MAISMLGRVCAAGVLAALLLTAPIRSRTAGQHKGQAQITARSDTHPSTSQADQNDLSITVYNSDLALVRDVRDVDLPGGTFQLKFMDIASSTNPATVPFRSLN